MATNVIMPTLGLTMEEGTINQWLKKEGDKVQKGEPLIVVETDKAAQEVEATADGVLARILHPEGAAVPVGTTIAIIAAEGEKVDASSLDGQGAQAKQAEQPAAAATSAPATTQSLPPRSRRRPRPQRRAHQDLAPRPQDRRRARTGYRAAQRHCPGGRIVMDDVLAAGRARRARNPAAAARRRLPSPSRSPRPPPVAWARWSR